MTKITTTTTTIAQVNEKHWLAKAVTTTTTTQQVQKFVSYYRLVFSPNNIQIDIQCQCCPNIASPHFRLQNSPTWL